MMEMWQEFVALADSVKLNTLMGLVLLNFVLGVAVGLKTHTFRLKLLGKFLLERVLPYVLVYVGVAGIALIEPMWKGYLFIVWGVIVATLVGAVATNLKELGLVLPDWLAGP